MSPLGDVKQRVAGAVDRLADDLEALSHRIHDNPELCFQEEKAIHPYIRISPDGVPGHSRQFAEWARSPIARAGMVAGAKALALTALDLLAAPDNLEAAKEDFNR